MAYRNCGIKLNIYTEKFEKFNVSVVILVIISILAWTAGLTAWIGTAHAANLTSVSDTLSNSDPGVKSNHTVKFTLKSVINASSTMVIDFPDAFANTSSPAFSNTDPTDYDIATSTAGNQLTVVAAGACPSSGLSRFEITSTTQAGNTVLFTFTHCNGTNDVTTSTPIIVMIGTNAVTGGTGDSQLVNPTATGSYVVTITAPAADSADTRVAIVNHVVVTATVATNFTFTVSGVASGQANANSTTGTTSVTTTATTIPWGTLTAGVTSTARQDLTVSTNARNGFSVTIAQDTNLVSGNGADINQFKDQVTSTPQVWASPAGTLDNPDTYGHEGVTSEDISLSSGNPFSVGAGVPKYSFIPNIATSTAVINPLEIFFHTGPANGSTANKGATKVGFQIEITSLQEAANDYTQNLTYVATPIF